MNGVSVCRLFVLCVCGYVSKVLYCFMFCFVLNECSPTCLCVCTSILSAPSCVCVCVCVCVCFSLSVSLWVSILSVCAARKKKRGKKGIERRKERRHGTQTWNMTKTPSSRTIWDRLGCVEDSRGSHGEGANSRADRQST